MAAGWGSIDAKNCGCEENVEFVLGYRQGLKHAAEN